MFAHQQSLLQRFLDMPTCTAYDVGMKTMQYTIRSVPANIDRLARMRVRQEGTSLNTVLLEALIRGMDAGGLPVENHELDDLIGTWVPDPACDAALTSFETIDAELWK
jgi:hypothetical protein